MDTSIITTGKYMELYNLIDNKEIPFLGMCEHSDERMISFCSPNAKGSCTIEIHSRLAVIEFLTTWQMWGGWSPEPVRLVWVEDGKKQINPIEGRARSSYEKEIY